MKIILASKSPRRKELLELITKKFEVLASDVEEKIEEGMTLQEQVTRLAYIKAEDVFNRTHGDRIVIGSDTIVVKNNQIYGKPKDKKDAKRMLKELLLGDKIHTVMTGLAVLMEQKGQYKEFKTLDEVKVYLKDISEEEIQAWIDTGEAMDKAGAYGIQNKFSVFVEKIEGNYTSIVGLPIHKLYDLIKEYIK